VIGPSARLGL